MSLGAKLSGERQSRGLSQRALAAELGVGLRSVLRWENGENEPSGLYARVVEDWLAGTKRDHARTGKHSNGRR